MLPDFGDDAPLIHAHQPVAFALFQAHLGPEWKGLLWCLFIGITDHDCCVAPDHGPDLRPAVMVLPREPRVRCHDEDFRTQFRESCKILHVQVWEVGLDEQGRLGFIHVIKSAPWTCIVHKGGFEAEVGQIAFHISEN